MAIAGALGGSRELLMNLTLRELRSKYKRSALGWTWSLVNPLATLAVYSVVFGLILRIDAPPGVPSGLDNFALYLSCALLPWNFLSNSLSSGVMAVVGNAGIVKKVWFPRQLLPISVVLSWTVSLLIEMGLVAAAMLLFGNMVLPWIPLVLAVVALQTAFCTGLAMLVAAANVYFRDIQHFLGIFLQVWFYLTPVVYSADLVETHGPKLFFLYRLNPMYQFVSAYRSLLYDLRSPSATTWGAMILCAGASLALGSLVFRRLAPKFAEEL